MLVARARHEAVNHRFNSCGALQQVWLHNRHKHSAILKLMLQLHSLRLKMDVFLSKTMDMRTVNCLFCFELMRKKLPKYTNICFKSLQTSSFKQFSFKYLMNRQLVYYCLFNKRTILHHCLVLTNILNILEIL